MLDTTRRVWYPENRRGIESMASVAISQEIENSVVKAKGLKARKEKTMSDTIVVPGVETKETQKTVFDLSKFDNILLKKKFTVPARPSQVSDVLAILGGDTDALMDLLRDGLMKRAQDAAYNSNDGWFATDEDGEITSEPYTGNYASAEKQDMINAAVLTLAKLNGYDKGLSKEDKKAKKDAARKFLRDNPAMLGGLQGA